MARNACKLIPALFFFALLAAAAATARPISSIEIPAIHSPCDGMMTDHAKFHPSTTAKGTAAAAVAADGAAVLGRKYGPLLFDSKPKGAFVSPSAPRNIGH